MRLPMGVEMSRMLAALAALMILTLALPAYAGDCGCGKAKDTCGCKAETKCGCKKDKCGCKVEKCGCKKDDCGCKPKACGCAKPKSCQSNNPLLPEAPQQGPWVFGAECCPRGEFKHCCERGEFRLLCPEKGKCRKDCGCDECKPKCKDKCGCGKCPPPQAQYRD
jgi:hypothetical protein